MRTTTQPVPCKPGGTHMRPHGMPMFALRAWLQGRCCHCCAVMDCVVVTSRSLVVLVCVRVCVGLRQPGVASALMSRWSTTRALDTSCLSRCDTTSAWLASAYNCKAGGGVFSMCCISHCCCHCERVRHTRHGVWTAHAVRIVAQGRCTCTPVLCNRVVFTRVQF